MILEDARIPVKKAICRLKSASPYSQGRFIQSEKSRDETHADFEKRVWKERCHVTKEGNLFIPPMCFKNCLAEAAKYKSIQIPGKGKSTFTKHFEAGILVVEPLVLDTKIDDIHGEWLHVPSDGRRGGSKRVEKCFPLVQNWDGVVEFLVLDEIITKDVFTEHLRDAGSFIGVGRFRPRNNGYYGRFSVEDVDWV
ncbi:MAG: hypothetical protein CMK32_10100 [Porticoccaceae bacterium]|nr:hypothetical protein [Porticoccaceae bacterium]